MMFRRTSSPFRRSLAVATLAVGLASCVTTDSDRRHLVPIPAALLSQMSDKGMSAGDPIFVRIFKKESELEVWKRDRSGQYALLKTYPMCRWSGQLGPKQREGDRQAPEGFYTVTPELMNPRSQFHLSFNLGYPNALERSQGFTGSALMVHGACTSAGCFAMTDDGVSEIYAMAREAFSSGQRSFQVQSLPFRMTPENMAIHRKQQALRLLEESEGRVRSFRGDQAAAEACLLRPSLRFQSRRRHGPLRRRRSLPAGQGRSCG